MARKNNFTKCVYIIKFKNYHKVYVGSTMRWERRKREHFYTLSKGCHSNRYLQRAHDKYGEENMEILELERCESYEVLLKREQYWIDFYKSSDKNFGFNLVKNVEQSGTVGYKFTPEQSLAMSIRKKGKPNNGLAARGELNAKAKTYELFSPLGEKTVIHNLKFFSEENGLEYDKMLEVAHNIRIEYKGWKLRLDRVHNKIKNFHFLSPEGKVVEITNLRQFCIKNNLSYKTMCGVWSERGISCSGWTKYFLDGSKKIHKGKLEN